jgi:CRISPR-associated protein Csd1
MLLQALHDYASRKKLLASLPFQRRTIHWLVPVIANGEVRGAGLVPLSTPVRKGKTTKEEPGQELLLPRFPGENNGGKAYYLAENFATVFGVRRDAGETLPAEPKTRQDRNPVFAFRHFWERITEAHQRTADARLGALLAFRERYLPERDGVVALFPWLEWRPNESSRKKEPEWHGRTAAGDWVPLNKVNTIAFEIDGTKLIVPADDLLTDPLWKDWAGTYRGEAFAESGDEAGSGEEEAATLCLITGDTGLPIARSHKPKILGVPGLASGGYVVSFAKEAPAFSSYGFEMGENAPVSEEAAAAYALALNDLLGSDDTSFKVGDVVFCFWVGRKISPSVLNFKAFTQASPRSVADFLKLPFAGIDRDLARREDFFSVALSANAGRVVIRQWIRVTLETALLNLKQWFEDLAIISLSEGSAQQDQGDEKGGPYSLFRLAAALVRDSKELKRMSEAVAELYGAALERLAPPIRLLEPLLAEFRSALVTDAKKKPRYPFNQARFALLKLILLRNAKGGFMPEPQLADTDDAAYNLGRLLCILSALQDQAHEYKLEGAGIVERYYGAASAAPAGVFAVLWKLHNHHLRKLEQQGDGGARAAFAIRGRIADIVAKFPAIAPNQPPRFPAQLTLEQQGRFALGFYQQLASDRATASVKGLLKDAREAAAKAQEATGKGKAEEAKSKLEEARALIAQARRRAEALGYEDLIELALLAEQRIQ